MHKPGNPATFVRFIAIWAAILVPLFMLCFSQPAEAKKKNHDFIVVSEQEEYDLGPYFRTLDDPEGNLTFEDVSKPDARVLFSKPESDYINFSMSATTHWLTIELRHIDKKKFATPRREWFIDVRRARLDVAELYVVRANGDVTKMQSDLRIPYSERPIRNVNSVFPLVTEQGESVVLYLKIRNTGSTFLPIHLRTPPNFMVIDTTYEILYGVFFGGMLVMILYNLFLLVAIREITYFYYVGYLVPVTLFVFIEIGHGMRLFEAFPQFLDKRIIVLCVWIGTISGMMFVQFFLSIPKRSPVVYACFKSLCVFMAVACVISYLIPMHIALLFTSFFCSSASWLIVILGIYHWRKHSDTNAGLMAMAWLFAVIGYLLYAGLATGLLPPNGFTIASMAVGILLEVTTLAFVLGERIKQTRNQVIGARVRSVTHLKRFRSFFDNAAEGIYQMTLNGRLLDANNAMAGILGFGSTERLMSHNKMAANLLFKHQGTSLRTLHQSRQIRDEISLIDTNGKVRHAIHSARIILKRDGQPSHIEGTLIDLTDRHENEKAQRAFLTERHEKELAKYATESKSNFLKDMSYQIRTPLNAIIGFSESMLDHSGDAQQRQLAVSAVIRNSQTLLQLVNDILDFSKIEAGKLAIEAIDIDLMALLQQVRDQFEPIAREKQLTFRVDCRFPLPARIISDPTRIRQVLQNLCSNAIKHTHKGSVKVIVRWDGIKQQLEFDVEDSGDGLTEKEIDHLMNASLQSATDNSTLGATLGMAITHQLVRMLGGDLHIDSRKGFGSRFSVGIACKIAGRDDWVNSVSIPGERKSSGGVPQLLGNVLLAEDNVVNQKLITRLISKTGAIVSLADNGQRAVELAQQGTFNLVLMDINMPIMDGLTATRLLRSQGMTLPIFALTAEHDSEVIKECIDAGCQGHLTKPVDIPAFYATLAQHLEAASPETRQEGQQ